MCRTGTFSNSCETLRKVARLHINIISTPMDVGFRHQSITNAHVVIDMRPKSSINYVGCAVALEDFELVVSIALLYGIEV